MKNVFGYASFAAIFFAASLGFAQDGSTETPVSPDSECSTDADCIDGQACEFATTDVRCPPCIDGEECAPCPEPEIFGFCVEPPPPPCTSDADCSAGDVCVTYSYEICSGSSGGDMLAPCLPDEPCETMPDPEPETGSCSTETESLCVPQYVAPCQIDSDCGAGFTCTDVEICECSVSGSGENNNVDGSEEAPEPGSCTCAPSGQKYCELNEVACSSDSDCSGSLVCVDLGTEPSTLACTSDPDGEVRCDEPVEPPAPEEYCAPVGYDDWGGASGGAGHDRVAEATGQSQDNLSSTDRIEWGPEANDGSKSESGGCSAAGADASVFGLLLLAGMLLRRRRG